MHDVHVIDRADEASEVLKPARIEILSRLAQPRTCPELARELGMTTQKVNYHMNVLKDAGLVELVEERRKRGTIEGVYQAVAKSFWLSPRLVAKLGRHARTKDQASLRYLLQLAEDLQLDISRLIERQQSDSRPSLGVNAHIQLRDETGRAEFLAEVKEIFAHLARKYGGSDGDSAGDRCGYRLMLACYAPPGEEEINHHENEEEENG